LLAVSIVLLPACSDDDPDPVEQTGKLRITFHHHLDGAPLVVDQMIYENEAGNPYLVTELQYFISDVVLHHENGTDVPVKEWEVMHYVDNDIPSTMVWDVYDPLPTGDYESISFVFGIKQEKNITLMFPNPPERDMFWPVFLGGGYHYLKMNGKWKRPDEYVASFDFHLGIGQIYASNVIVVDSITGYVDNAPTLDIPNSGFTITAGQVTDFDLVMNIENWWRSPHVLDLDVIGAYTMQNQEVMQKMRENAHDVFSVGTTKGTER